MKRRLLTLIVLTLSAASLPAFAEYPLKRTSSFNGDNIGRNPFLPIGYTRPKPGGEAAVVAAVVTPALQLDPAAFTVTSILIGGSPLAVINGKDYAAGDTMNFQGALVRVSEIRDGEVILTLGSQTIHVPLRRIERPRAVPPSDRPRGLHPQTP